MDDDIALPATTGKTSEFDQLEILETVVRPTLPRRDISVTR
jgi:hypothetical protein